MNAGLAAWSRRLVGGCLGAGLAACGSLLPEGRSDTPLPFDSYEAAQTALDKVKPFETRLDALKPLGFDPQAGPNVTLIPYPDVIARLAPHPGVPIDALDPGIRRCILAQTACSAYLFHFETQHRERLGGFWLDFLNFRRVTRTTGWRFDALVVVSDGLVLFRNAAGQARIDQTERQHNPLGPLQPAGESALRR